jgi:hypothetical protein
LRINKLLMCAATLATIGLAAQARADDRPGGVRVGTLTCHEKAGWGFVFGSSHKVHCVFSGNADHGYPERYEGAISKFGVDVGYKSSGVIVWAVLAPTDHLGRGDLGGHYGGATAGAAAGVGVGANVLVGGFHKSITLQPVSIEGETGLNVAAGIGELTLHPYRRD